MSLTEQEPALAGSPVWSGKIFNGAWIAGQGGAMEVVAPATGQVIATVGQAGPADLNAAVAAAAAGAWASFLHQGQTCMTAGRHLVPRHLAGEYVARLAEPASRTRSSAGPTGWRCCRTASCRWHRPGT